MPHRLEHNIDCNAAPPTMPPMLKFQNDCHGVPIWLTGSGNWSHCILFGNLINCNWITRLTTIVSQPIKVVVVEVVDFVFVVVVVVVVHVVERVLWSKNLLSKSWWKYPKTFPDSIGHLGPLAAIFDFEGSESVPFTNKNLVSNSYLMSLSFKFHKDPSFPLERYCTFFNLE